MMMSSQNLCLICCYSFQEKRNRFISADTIKSFNKFCNELDFPLTEDDDDNKRGEEVHSNISSKGLNLPFGECITVCGDCLSLVVVYVQQKAIQMEKEEHLVQLQRAVCKAIKELKGAVEDVQCHLNSLHGTVRMGDESNLDRLIARHKESHRKVKTFRERVLSLSTYGGASRNSRIGNNDTRGEYRDDILIKVEPLDVDNEVSFGNYEDSNFNRATERVCFPTSDNSAAEDNKPSSSTKPSERRRKRKRKSISCSLTARQEQQCNEIWSEEGEEEGQDCSDWDANNDYKEWDEDNDGSDFMDEEIIKTERPKRRYRRNVIRSKTTAGATRKMLKYGNLLSPERAMLWKHNLFYRVQTEERPNNNNIESIGGDDFKIVNDHLQLRGVVVKVHEKRRMLECMRCYKMYFEERDVVENEQSEPLESLMKTHILSKHFVVKKKQPVQEMEVVEYTSHTKSKITYKLADKNRYSYTRRCGKKDVGSSYFRCDFRKGNCSASIVHKNGKYIRLRKGWTEDGLHHSVHAPDVERTNKQIALGNAKYMYLTDDSKTIDEVCNIIMNQSDQQPAPLPLSKLKRAMVYSKYGSRGMAPEEKMNQALQCCYCGKIYKEGRGLSRHMKTVHKDVSRGDNNVEENGSVNEDLAGGQLPSSSTKDLRLIRRSSLLKPTDNTKVENKEERLSSLPRKGSAAVGQQVEKPEVQSSATGRSDQNNPAPSSSSTTPTTSSAPPSIVFNDPSAANNFVNRCINAIMQQVGVSVSPGSGGTTSTNPPSSEVSSRTNESSSKSSSQQNLQNSQVAQTSTGFQASHWQQQQSSSPNLGNYASHSQAATVVTRAFKQSEK